MASERSGRGVTHGEFASGVTEAADASNVEFGAERFVLRARQAYGGGAHAIRAKIFEEATTFCNSNFFDDATLMAVIIER